MEILETNYKKMTNLDPAANGINLNGSTPAKFSFSNLSGRNTCGNKQQSSPLLKKILKDKLQTDMRLLIKIEIVLQIQSTMEHTLFFWSTRQQFFLGKS